MTEQIYKEATSLKLETQKNEQYMKMIEKCDRCVFFTADGDEVEFVFDQILEPLKVLAIRILESRINVLKLQFDAL